MIYETKLNEYQNLINEALDSAVRTRDCLHNRIFEAMRYSLNAGGKRIRPILLLEFARVFKVDVKDALPFAVALEMIHTYSLIHDDLPCMDDDDMRRGRPTNHKAFDEATAVLAGDALLNGAFEHILNAETKLSPDVVLKAMKCLASAAGANGMVGGQIIDMEGEKRALTASEIEILQNLKTGALIKAAACIGCILGEADENSISLADKFASNIGLAFQIKDDILNVEGDAAVMGKDVGNDEKSGKSTFVKLFGLDTCKDRIVSLTEEAVDAVKQLPDHDFLVWIARDLTIRNN